MPYCRWFGKLACGSRQGPGLQGRDAALGIFQNGVTDERSQVTVDEAMLDNRGRYR